MFGKFSDMIQSPAAVSLYRTFVGAMLSAIGFVAWQGLTIIYEMKVTLDRHGWTLQQISVIVPKVADLEGRIVRLETLRGK